MIKTYELVSASVCPNCSKLLEAATGIDGASPKPGDITICAFCGVLLVFSDEMELTLLTGTELLDKLSDCDLRHKIELYQQALKQSHKAKARLN